MMKKEDAPTASSPVNAMATLEVVGTGGTAGKLNKASFLPPLHNVSLY